jgi:hypothetical protein
MPLIAALGLDTKKAPEAHAAGALLLLLAAHSSSIGGASSLPDAPGLVWKSTLSA